MSIYWLRRIQGKDPRDFSTTPRVPLPSIYCMLQSIHTIFAYIRQERLAKSCYIDRPTEDRTTRASVFSLEQSRFGGHKQGRVESFCCFVMSGTTSPHYIIAQNAAEKLSIAILL